MRVSAAAAAGAARVSVARAARSRPARALSDAAPERALWSAEPGQRVSGGFVVRRAEPFADFNLTAYHMTHEATGAEYLHVARRDSNNLFAVAFRTPPLDSTGVAHILEHTALCGSQRFPVRDPFFLMINRSLNTFMNAMTFADYTAYPFSTQNPRDFENLLSVYLDAAFFPRLRELDFRQEGHRLEFAERGNAGSPLQFKGVVFNEMKGAMSDPAAYFVQQLQSALFPSRSVTYHFNSGGAPLDILDLTHEQLRAFHARHYHPSNAVFLSYGDFAPPLDFVNERALAHFAAAAAAAPAPRSARVETLRQPRLSAPVTVRVECPPDAGAADLSRQVKACVSFLCTDAFADYEESVGLHLLSTLLLDGPASPMYKALLESKLGSDYSPASGYDASTREASFSFGLQGMREEDVPAMVSAVTRTLEEVARTGFPPERVAAAVHRLELAQKTVRSNFGLAAMYAMLPHWVHRGDPFNALALSRHLAAIQTKVASGAYFERLVRRHLLDNAHRVTLVAVPAADFAARAQEEERAKLTRVAAGLSAADHQRLIAQAEELAAQQAAPPNKDVLPTVRVADVQRQGERVHFAPPAVIGAAASQLLRLEQPTNGIGYWYGLADVAEAVEDGELRALLPLYSQLLGAVSTQGLGYRELQQELDLYTGGVGASVSVATADGDPQRHAQLLLYSASAFARNATRAAELTREVVARSIFSDAERLRLLLGRYATSLNAGLPDSGHDYARAYVAAALRPGAAASEVWGGLTHLRQVNALHADAAPDAMAALGARLQRLADALRARPLARSLVVGDALSLPAMERAVHERLAEVAGRAPRAEARGGPSGESALTALAPRVARQSFFRVPMQGNHSALGVATVGWQHEDAPALAVAAKLLTARFLHKEIREEGGAYGAGASQTQDGIFTFFSFRDPTPLRSLDTFRRSARWLLAGGGEQNVTPEAVEEALLRIFGAIDAPVPPQRKGLNYFITGRTDEQRQAFRERLLAVRPADVAHVARAHLEPALEAARDVAAVFGDEHAVPAEVSEARGWSVEDAAPRGALAGAEEAEAEAEAPAH